MPELIVKAERVLSVLNAADLVTAIEYVVVLKSSAVTTTVIVFAPTDNAILPEAVPEVTVVLFTVTEEVEEVVVGVTVI